MRTVVSVVTSLVCSSMVRWGSEEQKQEWLPQLCSGEALGCFGLTEPDTGSDASNLKTRAEKIDGGWRLGGGKMWISLGNYAKLALIFAQTDPELEAPRDRLLPRADRQRGLLDSGDPWKLGLKGSDTASLGLDGVEVPDSAPWARSATASRSPCRRSTQGATASRPAASGSARARSTHRSRTRRRTQFDRPIASFQLVQELIADMVVETEAARGLVWRAGWTKDAGKPSTTETSVAKLYATEAAVRCANNAIQVHGAPATSTTPSSATCGTRA